MKKLLLVLPLVAGCKMFNSAAPAVAADIVPVLTCVEDALDAGKGESMEAIVAACGVAAADVENTVTLITALASAPADAGADAGKSLSAKILSLPKKKK